MWTEFSKIGVPYYSPAQNSPVVFINDTGPDSLVDAPGRWNKYTVQGIPDDCVAVHLTGILIITYPRFDYLETVNLTLRLRRSLVESSYSPDYVGQIVEVRSGGVRSPFAAWVAVEERSFDMMWTRNTPVGYPKNASLGIKLYCDAYGRP